MTDEETHRFTATIASAEQSSFPIPASLQDLEHEPYNLLPYPPDFDDDDEAARADSFARLVDVIEDGNHLLARNGMLLFQPTTASSSFSSSPSFDGVGQEEAWLNDERIQSLYTLVR